MYLFNKVRNFININPVARRLFVKFISPFTVPLLILQNYLSIRGIDEEEVSRYGRRTIQKIFFVIKMGWHLTYQKINHP